MKAENTKTDPMGEKKFDSPIIQVSRAASLLIGFSRFVEIRDSCPHRKIDEKGDHCCHPSTGGGVWCSFEVCRLIHGGQKHG